MKEILITTILGLTFVMLLPLLIIYVRSDSTAIQSIMNLLSFTTVLGLAGGLVVPMFGKTKAPTLSCDNIARNQKPGYYFIFAIGTVMVTGASGSIYYFYYQIKLTTCP